MPAVGQPANVAREPYQGEVKEVDELVAGAPLAGQTQPESTPPAAPPTDETQTAQALVPPEEVEQGTVQNPGNLSVGGATEYPVLQRPARPMTRNQQVARALNGLAMVSPMVKRLSIQLEEDFETTIPQTAQPPGQGPADVMRAEQAEMGL